MNKKDSVVIIRPSLKDYPMPPEDQSDCKEFDCPGCKNKMWVSGKKRGASHVSLVSYE